MMIHVWSDHGVRPEARISTLELMKRLQLNKMQWCLLNRRLPLFDYLNRMEEYSSNKCWKLEFDGRSFKGQLRKTCIAIIRYLDKWKDSKELPINRDVLVSFRKTGITCGCGKNITHDDDNTIRYLNEPLDLFKWKT